MYSLQGACPREEKDNKTKENNGDGQMDTWVYKYGIP
jgi:hypothetical protein